MKIEDFKKTGFSLVELIVSIAITALIMVGLSAFFSNSFQNLFKSSEKVSSTLAQLVFSNVLQSQFINADSLQEIGGNGSFAILKNDPQKTLFPFSYLGEKEGRVVLKDFFVFNGYEGDFPSSKFSDDIAYPAGITQIGNQYYVTAPLENAIYECSNSCAQKLPLEGLKYPMDLTTDGMNLYITDAGNNRIVKIENVGTTNDLSTVTSDLNFPTGIEYYAGGKGFLFVSDTKNHMVKRVDLDGATVIPVVGNGTNQNCDNATAEYCQLNYPMGLALGDDGTGEALYIADTGNGRILKIFKPEYLTEFELDFNAPEESAAFKEIKFVFPPNTNLENSNLASLTSENGDLNPNGNLVPSENIFTYELWTKLFSNTQDANNCNPKPCIPTKNKIEVIKHELFDNGKFNQIKLADDVNNNFSVNSKVGIKLTLSKDLAAPYPSGTEVVLASPISANTSIEFKFTGVDTTGVQGGFRPVTVQMYNEVGKFLSSKKIFFRFRGDTLGLPDDLISVHSSGLDYPTGLGWSGNALIFSETPIYPKIFSDFDYETDFEIEDFKLTTKNEGKLLEMTYKTLKDAESEDKVYESHVINTALKP